MCPAGWRRTVETIGHLKNLALLVHGRQRLIASVQAVNCYDALSKESHSLKDGRCLRTPKTFNRVHIAVQTFKHMSNAITCPYQVLVPSVTSFMLEAFRGAQNVFPGPQLGKWLLPISLASCRARSLDGTVFPARTPRPCLVSVIWTVNNSFPRRVAPSRSCRGCPGLGPGSVSRRTSFRPHLDPRVLFSILFHLVPSQLRVV